MLPCWGDQQGHTRMCILGIAVNTVGCRSYEYAVIPDTHIKREGGREGERVRGRERGSLPTG